MMGYATADVTVRQLFQLRLCTLYMHNKSNIIFLFALVIHACGTILLNIESVPYWKKKKKE